MYMSKYYKCAVNMLPFVFQGRARARESSYVILIDEENFDTFNENVRIFKDIEQV